eukprot:CAMPEP_0184754782 /NCGR_PEP_ID=MMETSP0315-20130426/44800_1 /TAXON_ID=101924 /ORGANISM="Rhodosorus marinus, Strain UTEX LB 2760" /LENGTH=413 /DNA_ID=CAMNT_0027234217 /DNA_START=118 /DNA_END=1359 /DNA_ORIENTATION=-
MSEREIVDYGSDDDRLSGSTGKSGGGGKGGKIGGYYAKAKQRVLNKMGKRTTLTKNPRVDYISKRIEKINKNKHNVSQKSEKLKNQLNHLIETATTLNEMMLDVWKEEMGTREWDEEKEEFIRNYDGEEKAAIHEMDEAANGFATNLKTARDTYVQSLMDSVKTPLTLGTNEEENRVKQIQARKDEYKHVRTQYSDAMIDYERECSGGNEPSRQTLDRVEDARARYEEYSDRLTEASLHFEKQYREEVCQKIESHFYSSNKFVRAVSASYHQFYPHAKSLSLDARAYRAAVSKNVEEARKEAEMNDTLPQHVQESLPKVPFGQPKNAPMPKIKSKADARGTSPENNPFGENYDDDGMANVNLAFDDGNNGTRSGSADVNMFPGTDGDGRGRGEPKEGANPQRGGSDDVFGLDL